MTNTDDTENEEEDREEGGDEEKTPLFVPMQNPLANLLPKVEIPKILSDTALANMNSAMPAVARAASLVSAVSPMQETLAKIQIPALQTMKTLSEIAAKANVESLRKLQDALGPIQKSIAFLECCDKTEWPIFFLVVSETEEKYASLIDEIEDADTLVATVSEMVISSFDEKEVSHFENRWQHDPSITPGQKELMITALHRYKSGDYLCCTAVLMCLFEGLIEHYYQTLEALVQVSRDEIQETKQWLGVGSSGKAGTRPAVKDKFVALIMLPDRGLFYWKAAGQYILNTTLTNRESFRDLGETNPLRNKICHGKQTNYGTQIHALKAILCVDLVVRLNQAGIESLRVVQEQ